MTSLALPLTQPAFVFLVLLAIILIAPIVAERLRFPGLIGLIVAGIVVGPSAFGVLQREGPIELLGGVGLLYLMFVAGIDLDLEGFQRHRRDSVAFGTITFVVPMVVNTWVGVLLGLDLLAAILVASAFTSHTLLVYPMVQRFGLVKNRSVTATIGATLIVTVAALLVLAVAAGAAAGDLAWWFWVTFGFSLAVFLVLTLWGLPRLTRWFFSVLGQDRAVRFSFVLVALFGISALADLAGIEPIVGAFLAGLALNRFVPAGSVLMERVQFLGSSLLIPLFLIWTGMLIDPVALLLDPRGLLLGGAFLASALGAKWLAALPTAKLLGFDRSETGLMFALSGGQAAGALAAVIVGVNIGLLGEEMLNAVVLVIVGTAVACGLVGARYAPLVKRPVPKLGSLGSVVIVPIANPRSAGPLVKLAALVAASDSGHVVPLNILSFDASHEQVEEHKEITAEAEKVALRHGAEARSVVRIDASPTAGVLHTIIEEGGTCLLLGWKGYANLRENFFGGVIDTVLSRAPVPALVCRPGADDAVKRIVLSVTHGDLAPTGLPGLQLASEIARRLARQADVPLLVLTKDAGTPALSGLLGTSLKLELYEDERRAAIALREHTREGDVVVVSTPPTIPGLGRKASRVARAVVDRTVVATVPR